MFSITRLLTIFQIHRVSSIIYIKFLMNSHLYNPKRLYRIITTYTCSAVTDFIVSSLTYIFVIFSKRILNSQTQLSDRDKISNKRPNSTIYIYLKSLCTVITLYTWSAMADFIVSSLILFVYYVNIFQLHRRSSIIFIKCLKKCKVSSNSLPVQA